MKVVGVGIHRAQVSRLDPGCPCRRLPSAVGAGKHSEFNAWCRKWFPELIVPKCDSESAVMFREHAEHTFGHSVVFCLHLSMRNWRRRRRRRSGSVKSFLWRVSMKSEALLLSTSAGTEDAFKTLRCQWVPNKKCPWFSSLADCYRRQRKRNSSCGLSIETVHPSAPAARQEFPHFAAVYALGPR